MAMEYFPKGDLHTYICDHDTLSDGECSQIVSQVVSGIALMHAEGFAHRDVKPKVSTPWEANDMLTEFNF